MQDWNRFRVAPETPLLTVLETIDKGALGFALVCSEAGVLLGVVTDGDIRRALVESHNLNILATNIMNRHPITMRDSHTGLERRESMVRLNLVFLPILDSMGHVVDVHTSEWLPGNKEEVVGVVLMAGGLGSRLGEMTANVPKPLLKVGGEPIIERIIKQFQAEGFNKIVLTVRYKAEMIRDYLGDGSDLKVSIDYIRETKRLGTAGALSLIDKGRFERLIVFNCDVLCSTSFKSMLRFHLEQDACATMAARQHPVTVPFGVIDTDGVEIRSQVEKPVLNYLVNAGFYILEADVLGFVPENTFFDMPDLFDKLRAAGRRTVVYPMHEKWIDIGRPEDFENAEAYVTNLRG